MGSTRPSGPGVSASVASRILDAIDDGVSQRWQPALTRARAATGTTVEERVRDITRTVRKEVGMAGAAAGGAAAVPAVGLATSTAAFAVELGWSTFRLTDLILTIAAIHGYDQASIEERRLWVLSILTFGDGASSMVTRLAGEMGGDMGKRTTRQIPAETLRRLNKSIGRTIVTKYGARRGALALGRAIPFGIGAALGYGLNSYVVKATARDAHAFFSQLPDPLRSLPMQDHDG